MYKYVLMYLCLILVLLSKTLIAYSESINIILLIDDDKNTLCKRPFITPIILRSTGVL